MVDSSIRLDSTNINALYDKVKILIHLKEYTKALPTLNYGIKICPENNYNILKGFYFMKASAIYSLQHDLNKYFNDLDLALNLCEKRLKTEENNMFLIYDKIIILCNRNKKNAAKIYLDSIKKKISTGDYSSLIEYIENFEFKK